MKVRSFVLPGAAFVALAVVATGCGGGSSSPSTGSTASSGASVAEAKAYLEPLLKNPTGIGYDKPVSKAVPKGLNVVALENTVPITKRVNDEREKAAKLLGWNFSRVPVGNKAEDPGKAMDQALAKSPKPDVIFEAGYGTSQLSQQLAKAKSMGVKVVAECITDPASGALIGVRCDKTSADQQAKASAAYIVANGTGSDHVQLFGTSTFPILGAYNDSFIKYMKQWCPGCEVKNNEFQLTDIGTKLPGAVVSAVQRDPKSNWVIFGFGDAMVGVQPALEAAGLASKVKIGGEIPGPDQYKQLRAGKQAFWTQNISPFMGFIETDVAVRSIVGDDLTTVTGADLPNQVLTSANIGTAVFDGDFWLGFGDYVNAFKKQWLLS
jgi:ribose transport system substrate-binding protein